MAQQQGHVMSTDMTFNAELELNPNSLHYPVKDPRQQELQFDQGAEILHPAATAEPDSSFQHDMSPGAWKAPLAPLPFLGVDVADTDANAWFPGEMIDGGMEWLQALFTNDLDSHAPSTLSFARNGVYVMRLNTSEDLNRDRRYSNRIISP
jgi:hypothetical protein